MENATPTFNTPAKNPHSQAPLVFGLVGGLIIFVAPLISPLSQSWMNYPFWVYSNALDEGSYLQFDQSAFVSLHMIRPVQYLVTFLHEMGWPGGMVNAIFDAVIPLLLWTCLCYCLHKAGINFRRAATLSLASCLANLIFLRPNPFFEGAYYAITSSDLITWITTPAAAFAPIVRTPEPQSSYLILAFAAVISLKVRSFLPLFATFPVLYSFFALPVAFCVSALYISMCAFRRIHIGLISIFCAVAISIGLSVYYAFFLGSYGRHLALETRLPLFSVMGTTCAFLYCGARRNLNEPGRKIALVSTFATWFAANHQIISGFTAQPSNAESYFGAVVAGGLLVAAISHSVFLLRCFTAGLSLLYLLVCVSWTRDSLRYYSSDGPSPELVSSLRTAPESIAVNDVLWATRLNLALPKQKSTLLSVSRVYVGVDDDALDRYVCAKQSIRESGFQKEFEQTFRFLDSAYRDDFEDPLLNLRRISGPRASFDVTSVRTNCERFPKVRVFLVR